MNLIFHLLSTFFYEEKWGTGLMVFTSFLMNLLQTGGTSTIYAKLVEHITNRNEQSFNQVFIQFIILLMLFIVLFTFYRYLQIGILTKLRHWLKNEMIRIILQTNNEEFSELNYSRLSNPINRLSGTAFYAFNDIVTSYIPNFMFLLVVFFYLGYHDVGLGIGFASLNMLIPLFYYFQFQSMIEANESFEKATNDHEYYVLEILNNMDKIIFRGQSVVESDLLKKKSELAETKTIASMTLGLRSTGIMMLFIVSLMVLTMLYVSRRLFKSDKNFSITTVLTLFTILTTYRDHMVGIVQNIPESMEFYGRIKYVLTQFTEISDKYEELLATGTGMGMGEKDLDLAFHRICFDHVTFSYQNSKEPVLREFNLCIDTVHSIIGIRGLSGNGKSTLAKLLMRMYQPTSGKITIDGMDLATIHPEFLRRKIVYVSQNSKLFDKTVLENMLYGCPNQQHCHEALLEIWKFPKIRELFKQINVGKKAAGALGENLSGGQRQIVNLISGFVHPSAILILDEPTNALDPALKAEVIELVRQFAKYKQCIIVISHDKEIFPLFNQTVVV